MKTIKQILENGSTPALLVLSIVTTVLVAGTACLVWHAIHGSHTRALARKSVAAVVAGAREVNRLRLAIPATDRLTPSISPAWASLPAGDSRTAMESTAVSSGSPGLTKPPGESPLVHGALNGSVKPAEEQPWRHWLQ